MPAGRPLLLVGSIVLLAGGGDGLRTATRSKTKGLDDVISILLSMMGDFRSQTEHDEESWQNYQTWARETEEDRTEFVRNQQALVMANTATLNAKQSEVQQIGEELAQLARDIQSTQRALTELVQMRHDEHAQHQVALQDLGKTISAVNRAIEILEGHYAANGAGLAEIKKRVQLALTMAGVDRSFSSLSSLVQSPDWLSVDGAQAYGSHDGHSGASGVISTLNELRSTLDSNRQQAIEGEASAVREFEATRDANQAQLTRQQETVTAKTTQKGNAEAAISQATATIDSASRNQADAEAYLKELAADVATFQTEYQTRSRTRDDEKSATQSALDALQSISAGAKESTGAAAASMLQQAPRTCTACAKEATVLAAISRRLGGSAALMQVVGELSQRSHSAYEPTAMNPVKELLERLISRLEAEQSAETTHHDWCETEKTSSTEGKHQREETVKELQSEIERLTTATDQLKAELLFLHGEIDRVAAETREAKRNREQAHESFARAKHDHDEVISAIEAASSALGAQYSFAQRASAARHAAGAHIASTGKTKTQESPFASYESGSGSASSASEMLNDLLQRYTAARNALVEDEKTAQAAYDALEATNTQFLTDSENQSNAKMAERRAKLTVLKNAKEDITTDFTELRELTQYLQDLRPSCDDIRSTFEDRKRRREAEIEALRECMEVLDDPTAVGL